MKHEILPPTVYRETGITVAELKAAIRDWPETNDNGEPTEVWLTTGQDVTSVCVGIEQLNRRTREDGSESADLLLSPSEAAFNGEDEA